MIRIFQNKNLMNFEKNNINNEWIKQIDLDTITFDNYPHKNDFKLVSKIILDNDLDKNGKKKRSTVIKFEKLIPDNEFKEVNDLLYIFTIDKIIVKIGGSRTSLKGRCSSYLCGHHTKSRQKSGSCSNTNAFIYNTFEYYLKKGYEILMYSYILPVQNIKTEIMGNIIYIRPQVFHAYESVYLKDYKIQNGKYPCLNDNCDPNY